MRTAYTGGCVQAIGGFVSLGGESLSIETGGKVYHFSWHHYFGPTAEDKDGNELKRQPGERSPFWDAVHWWHKQGMKVDEEGRAIFEHETELVQIMQHIGGNTYLVCNALRPFEKGTK